MKEKIYDFSKVKEKYLKFLQSQEVLGEPFRDKLKQLLTSSIKNYFLSRG